MSAHITDDVRKSPNDPKLSDGGAWRGACPTVERTPDAPNVDAAPLAESTRRDTRSCSMQRLVRRCVLGLFMLSGFIGSYLIDFRLTIGLGLLVLLETLVIIVCRDTTANGGGAYKNSGKYGS